VTEATELSEQASLEAMYRARIWSGYPLSLLWEDDRGAIHGPNLERRLARYRERIVDVRQALAGRSSRPRVLEVGCRDAFLLESLRASLPIDTEGLEIWSPWRQQAQHRGVAVHNTTLENWADKERFDVVVDCDLLCHLPEPVEHLRHVAERLAPGGLAIIEVPNLLGVQGDLLRHVLRSDSPLAFTPRALITACRRAGLLPIRMHKGTEIRLTCRRIVPDESAVTAGPDAPTVAHLAWGNDLRRGVKRALAQTGPTRETLRMAARVYRRCPYAASRADIAIEIAAQCERCSDYDQATKWLSRSLADRQDPEVEATLAQLQRLAATVRYVTAPQPAPTLRKRASATIEPVFALAS
jgi:SAM-dependent methyltransferase